MLWPKIDFNEVYLVNLLIYAKNKPEHKQYWTEQNFRFSAEKNFRNFEEIISYMDICCNFGSCLAKKCITMNFGLQYELGTGPVSSIKYYSIDNSETKKTFWEHCDVLSQKRLKIWMMALTYFRKPFKKKLHKKAIHHYMSFL